MLNALQTPRFEVRRTGAGWIDVPVWRGQRRADRAPLPTRTLPGRRDSGENVTLAVPRSAEIPCRLAHCDITSLEPHPLKAAVGRRSSESPSDLRNRPNSSTRLRRSRIAFRLGTARGARALRRRGNRAGPVRLAPCQTIGIARAVRTGASARGCLCPKAAVRAMPARLLLLCVLFGSSWLAAEGGRQVGAAGVLYRRGGRGAVAVSVGVAGGVLLQPRVVRCAALLYFWDASLRSAYCL